MTIFDRNRPSLEAGTTEAVPRQSHAREEKIDARFLTRLQQTIGNRAVASLLARQVPDQYAPLRVGSTATGAKGSKQLTWLDKLRGEIGASGVMLATEAFRSSGWLGWLLTHEPGVHRRGASEAPQRRGHAPDAPSVSRDRCVGRGPEWLCLTARQQLDRRRFRTQRRNHPLVDGNKRLAWLATYVFCAKTGLELDPDDDAAYDLVIAVATGAIDDVPEIASRLAAFAAEDGGHPD